MTDERRWYAGVDWASESHHVLLTDGDGRMISEKIFKHSGEGFAEMAAWLMATSGVAEPSQIHIAIEQAAFDRGSFATMLGVWFLPDWQGVRVFAIGDTILAFVDSGRVVRAIPYVQPGEFDQPPQLLSTNLLENRWLDDEAISHAWQELNIASHEAPTLLLMTDALGRWLLDQPDSERVCALLNVHDEQAFREFVERERAEGRLRRDDTTLVVIGVSGELSADH